MEMHTLKPNIFGLVFFHLPVVSQRDHGDQLLLLQHEKFTYKIMYTGVLFPVNRMKKLTRLASDEL